MMKRGLRTGWKKLVSVFFGGDEENHEEKVNNRIGLIYRVLGILFLGEAVALFWNSGYLPGLNPHADQYKEMAIQEADNRTILPGDMYDRNGNILVENKVEEVTKTVVETVTEEIDGVQVEKEVEKETKQKTRVAEYTNGLYYTQVLGYTGKKEFSYQDGVPRAERKQQYRLMQYYEDLLYQNADLDGTKGPDFTLTLDHNLQMAAAESLAREMTCEERGSVVVLDAKTAEVLAMVSFPTFDANDLKACHQALNSGTEQEERLYPISHKGREEPGSIFKIVMSVALIDHGLENFRAPDADFTVNGTEIVDSYAAPGDEITYYEGMERSSNDFFAHAALELGADRLTETAKKFRIGEEVELDFGTISSQWSLDGKDQAKLAMTGFGQGETLLSTIYAAMIGQTIANDGVMMKPYMVQKIESVKGETLKTGEPEILSEVTGKETADKVTEAMLASTRAHLGVAGSDESRRIYETYAIASKTGTAETGNKEAPNNAWFVSFAPADDPEYVVVVNQCDTSKFGQDMMDTAASVYKYLFEEK